MKKGEIDRKQFKMISALTASWTTAELNILSSVIASRKDIRTIFSAERIDPIMHLFGPDGRVKNNQIWLLLQEVVRGHLIEREYAIYLQAHPQKYGPKKHSARS